MNHQYMTFSVTHMKMAENFSGAKIERQGSSGRFEFPSGTVMFANFGDVMIKSGKTVEIVSPGRARARKNAEILRSMETA